MRFLFLAFFFSSSVHAADFYDATLPSGRVVKAEKIESVGLKSKAVLSSKIKGKSAVLKSTCFKGQGEVSKVYVGTNCSIFLPTGEEILLSID